MLLRALRQPQSTLVVLPQPAIVGGKPSSPTPAGSAAATSQLHSPQPKPLPSIQRHHLTPHDLAEPPRPSASTDRHDALQLQQRRLVVDLIHRRGASPVVL